MRYSEQISSFLNFINQAEKDYRTSYEMVGICDTQDIDLLHAMENAANKRECNKISWDMHENRVVRRKHKDRTAELLPVIRFTEEHKKSLEKLKQTLGEVRKEEEYHESDRRYNSRTEFKYGKRAVK
jgi:hypothetical protein